MVRETSYHASACVFILTQPWYFADYSYNTDAEQHCEEAIGQALGIDQFSVDANHALANVRLSQSKPIEASVLGEFDNELGCLCILSQI
jgi:hypothetical protein